jgi:tetratricopeptide (TPR) repeat protein
MASQVEIINVFLASPGDLAVERKKFGALLEKFNRVRARSVNHRLEPIGWEGTLLGVGRPQELINEDLKTCDLFVMLLWHRWGSPSGQFSSGTEEEFNVAYKRYQESPDKVPHLLLYFRSVPQAQRADPGDELKRVNAFRTKIETERILLYGTYDQPKQWEDKLLEHLSQWLDRKLLGREFAVNNQAAPRASEISQMRLELEKLQREVKETNKALQTEKGKLRTAAIGLAVEAARLLAQGKLTLAEEKFTQSVELYEEPEVLINFGLFLFQTGSLERAQKRFELVKALPSSSEIDPQRAAAYKHLGNIYLTWGKADVAEQMFEHAIAIARTLDRPDLISDFTGSLGNVYIERGEIEKAAKAYTQALKIVEAIDHQDGMRKAYGSLGNVYVERRKWTKARAAYQQTLELARQLGHKEGMEHAYLGLGLVAEGQKDFARAKQYYEQALKLAKKLGHKVGMERAFGNLGNVHAARGELRPARQMYEATLALATALGHKEGMANTFVNLGNLDKRAGKSEQAQQHWQQALTLYKDIGNKEEVKKLQALIRPGQTKAKSKADRKVVSNASSKKARTVTPGRRKARVGHKSYRPIASRAGSGRTA